MTFREFLKLKETTSLNPLGGPTASGSTGMNFWSGENANLSVGNSYQSTGPVMPKDAYNQQKTSLIPPGPFSMVVGKAGPNTNKGGDKAAFSRTQENPIARPGSNLSPRGIKAKWQGPSHSPFSLGNQVASIAPGVTK